jgi:hypothetical protein
MSRTELTITELFDDGTAIDEALREAARDARRFHKAIGNPMATWKDGQVVWIQPEDIVVGTCNLVSVNVVQAAGIFTLDGGRVQRDLAGQSGEQWPVCLRRELARDRAAPGAERLLLPAREGRQRRRRQRAVATSGPHHGRSTGADQALITIGWR